MNPNNKVMVLVSSCDKYSDLWDPFFTLYKKFWNPSYPIVLITEAKPYSFEDLSIETYCLYANRPMPTWSELLRDTLEKMDCEYVIFFLDDFFLRKPVDQKEVDAVLEYMDKDPSIASFGFLPIKPERNIDDGKYENYELRPARCEYKLNTQVAVWRRKDLLKYLRPHESAWYFETLGSRRASRYHEKFYTRKPDASVVFDYEKGGAVYRGKWSSISYQFCLEQGIDLSKSTREAATYAPGSTEAKRNYYLSRLKPKIMVKALIARWKSLKW